MNRYSIRREPVPVAVLALDEICFPDDDRVRIEDTLWWVVLCGKEAVAYGGLRPCQNECNKGVGFLCRVGVVPKHRGKGLQKRLIYVRERAAKAAGLDEVVTYCVPWNCASLNSLIACGYKFYRPATKWGGSGSIYLRKRLV